MICLVRLVISLVALVYQRGYLLQFPRCETASKQFFWQTLPTGGQVHIVTETMWDQLVVPWEGDHDLIHYLRHRKYAVNFELQIRRKSVRELLQIDYGIPLEVPWQPKGRFPKSDVWFLGRRCFKTLRYLEISSGFTCWTRKLTIHTYLSYQCLFISIQYNTIQAYPPSSALRKASCRSCSRGRSFPSRRPPHHCWPCSSRTLRSARARVAARTLWRNKPWRAVVPQRFLWLIFVVILMGIWCYMMLYFIIVLEVFGAP